MYDVCDTGVNFEVDLTMALVVVVVLDIKRGTPIGAHVPPLIVEVELKIVLVVLWFVSLVDKAVLLVVLDEGGP